jgi:hypothetical protein
MHGGCYATSWKVADSIPYEVILIHLILHATFGPGIEVASNINE